MNYKGLFVDIRPTSVEDIRIIERDFHPDHFLEVTRLGMGVRDALAACLISSECCYTGVYKGKPIVLIGLSKQDEDHGACVFMLGTRDLDHAWYSVGKLSRMVIDGLLKMEPLLYNWVDAKYERSIKWLKWLGAEFGEEVQSETGDPFLYFEFKRGE